jgi:uncharacterized membrane protein (UPF0127 family)
MNRLTFLFSFGLLMLGGCEPQAAPSKTLESVSPTGLAQTWLTIRSDDRARRFTVEIARTPEQQQHGLMFRRSLAPDHGMLFPFAFPRQATFWMKDTLIPLDMIFIRPDGSIARIAAMTAPKSLDTVDSGEPVAAVLEIAGGRAAQLGIEPGDVVRWGKG